MSHPLLTPQPNRFPNLFGLICAIALFLIFCLQPHTAAQSTANLQADIFDLRSQISQLRSEIAQLRQQQGYPSAPPRVIAPNRSRVPTVRDDQIVDRLAILAIEAKDRLNNLEARITKLEARLK